MLDSSDEEITVMPDDSDEEADMKEGPDCWTAVMRRQEGRKSWDAGLQ